ncbi:MAG: penicillin-insensitive murein endopeptidase [Rhodospirillaceae bacterium]
MGVLLLIIAAAGSARAEEGGAGVAWTLARSPSPGLAQVIGGYAHGCLAGGVALTLDGPGYQVMRPARRRYFGHPSLIDYLQKLGRRVHDAGLPAIALGDLSQPRGGPMNFGHASHQSGLDVDIWLRLDLPPLPRDRRDSLKEISLVNGDTHRVQRPGWSAAHAKLLRLAAADPRVERIFVNPAIKFELCGKAGADRDWLRLIRPWYGHDDHIHVRLHCPADSPLCEPQKPLPDGDGCGSELMSWMPEAHPPRPVARRTPRAEPDLPLACYHVIVAAGPTLDTTR